MTSDFFLDKVGNLISTFSSGGIDGEAEVEVGPLDLVPLLESAIGSISRFLTLDMLVMWLCVSPSLEEGYTEDNRVVKEER